MGVYMYRLRATGRKVLVDGEPVECYPLRFAYRMSWSGWSAQERREEQLRQMADDKAEAHWSARTPPALVAIGELKEGAHVYDNWSNTALWVDTESPPGLMAGTLVKQGRRLALRRWGRVKVNGERLSDDQGRQLREMLKGNWTVQADRSKTVYVCTEDPDEALIAKLIVG